MSFPSSFPVGLNVEWMQADSAPRNNPYLKNWLLDTGSLTERVQSLCHQFSLNVLGQAETALHANEQSLLSNSLTHQTSQAFQVREVLLCGNTLPWVFARSVIPQRLVEAELANLGSEPLGKRLFNDARFLRSEFELCCLPAIALGFERDQQLWGRRSLFTLGEDSMIVAEVFLPDAPVYYSRYDNGTDS
ncbi:chorismate--pyruvate lyase family protein [Alteromonas lipotrueae]|uniref:chorismate--pyruvate lyase family protein n=1 Tax=Alteromonas lipotrueae TaxID=2803814 RepID=UPI001C468E1E|nr:chorismate lyase [Alteromonas lipotrueae]